MTYKIQITYNDNVSATLIISDKDLDKFMDAFNSGNLYLNDTEDMGFWTHQANVRHIIVSLKKDEPCPEPKKEEPSLTIAKAMPSTKDCEVIDKRALEKCKPCKE